MDNILALHEDLINHTYKHGGYQAFKINDPKPRDIHKAKVRDRLLHHAVYRILYPFFDRTFISDSYSCRLNKGSHKAIRRFRKFANKASNNNTRTCWILKCDIRKFFANIDHEILMGILKEYILDKNIIDLLENIIESFHSHDKGIGLPLGNLTSQLFVNIYMNEFDQFVKHKLKAMFYIRYADDFMILSENKKWLEDQMPVLQEFLQKELRLEMHPDKVYIKTLSLGVDFLGWVNFFDHRVLRKSTGKRMAKRLSKTHDQAVLSSYLGILFHGNTEKLVQKFFNVDFFRFLGKNRNVEENTLGS
ncbi:MAG: hypothetical protein HGB08_00985 [Candidatus Moranbacteria bacterium]|nr:hypothetical protein [Candidatus Moranbacteria bacterium]